MQGSGFSGCLDWQGLDRIPACREHVLVLAPTFDLENKAARPTRRWLRDRTSELDIDRFSGAEDRQSGVLMSNQFETSPNFV